jgi:chromosome segregation and condensation protein ScpB
MAIGFYESRIFDSDDLYSTTKLFYSRTGITNFKESQIFSSDDLYNTTKLFYSRTAITNFKEAKLKDVSKGHPKRQYGRD